MRVFSVRILAVFFSIFSAYGLYASNLDIARQALRDNLWSIARTRAGTVDGAESKLIILESYAREGKWSDILSSLDSWTVPADDAFLFYRSLAKAKLEGSVNVSEILDKYKFLDSIYAKSLACSLAQMALKNNDADGARQIVEMYSLDTAGDDAKAVSAEVFIATGDKDRGERLCREVVSSTNVSDRAYVLSAWNLNDVAILSNAYQRVDESADLRRLVGLRYGLALLMSPESFSEGKKLITALVNDSPGTDGAREAFVMLAQKCLDRGEYEESEKYFQNAIEAWPKAARDYTVHEGRGWTLLKLGKHNEAILSFAHAEECATSDTDRATAVLMQGDILSLLGRGDESMSKYRVVLSKYPMTPAGLKLKKIVELKDMESRGRDLYADFRFADAMEVFAEISKRDPEGKPRMDYLEMLCLYGQGKDIDASAKAKSLADFCPDTRIRAEAALWLAKFYYNNKQWRESCALFSNYATNMTPSSAQAPSALLWASRAAFAEGDFRTCIDLVTKLARFYPDSSEKPSAYVLQGESLIELSRFDEAIVVLQKAVADIKIQPGERLRAKILMGDALFVMGADNPGRYNEALESYRALYIGEHLDAGQKINIAFKIARIYEKMNQPELALDQYYGDVVCAYRDARARGVIFNEEVKANFTRAAFRLADEFERRGQDEKAKNILRLVIKSDVKSSEQEARRKLRRIKKKGSF